MSDESLSNIALFPVSALGPGIWNNWFWEIEDEPGMIYASGRIEKVSETDAIYIDWIANGNTPRHVATDADLYSDIEPLCVVVAWKLPEWGRQPGQIDGLPLADGTAWTGPTKVDPVEKLKQFLDANPDVKEYLME